MKSCKIYDNKGKLVGIIKVKMKKGRPYTSKEYRIKGKKKTLIYKQTFAYKGKKLVKIKWRNLLTNTSGTTKATSGASNQKVSGVTVTTTYKITHQYTYDMVGNILEDVCTETTTKVPAKGKKSEVVTKTVKKDKYKKTKVLRKYLKQILNGYIPAHH